MFGIYIFSAIVGVPLVALMLFFGDADFDGDVDLDADLDADFDADGDLDLDAAGGWLGGSLAGMLSVRSIVFFLAGFGALGLLMGLFWGYDAVATAMVASAGGLLGAYLNSALTGWLKRNQTSGEMRLGDIAGSAGTVSVPIEPGKKGKVTIDVDGRPIQMTARHFRGKADQLAVGESVVVVEFDERGTALIARLDDLSGG